MNQKTYHSLDIDDQTWEKIVLNLTEQLGQYER